MEEKGGGVKHFLAIFLASRVVIVRSSNEQSGDASRKVHIIIANVAYLFKLKSVYNKERGSPRT